MAPSTAIVLDEAREADRNEHSRVGGEPVRPKIPGPRGPIDQAQVVEAVKETAAKTPTRRSVVADVEALSPTVRAKLNSSYGDTEPGALFGCAISVAMSTLQAGWNQAQVKSLLMNKTYPLSELMYLRKPSQGLRARTLGSARVEADKAIAKAMIRIADSPAGADARSTRQLLGEVTAAMRAESWAGRAGHTDLLVLNALMAMASKRGGATFSMSCRQIAQAVSCSASTASASLKRLEERDYISAAPTPTKRSDGRPVVMANAASTWTLRAPDHLAPGRSSSERERGPVGGNHVDRVKELAVWLADDLWSSAGLGQSAGRVAFDLTHCGQASSLRALAKRTGLSLRTVHLAIAKLRRAGMVASESLMRTGQDLKKTLAAVDADRLPGTPTASGAARRRAERIAGERAAYTERLRRGYLFMRRARLEQVVLDRTDKTWVVDGEPDEAAVIVCTQTGVVMTDFQVREEYGEWRTMRPTEQALSLARVALGISKFSKRNTSGDSSTQRRA